MVLDRVARDAGQVKLDGQIWTARPYNDDDIYEPGDSVTVMHIDGATAVVLLELGFPPPLGRGVFLLSRVVGICAHAWEQTLQGGRIKGPLPPVANISEFEAMVHRLKTPEGRKLYALRALSRTPRQNASSPNSNIAATFPHL